MVTSLEQSLVDLSTVENWKGVIEIGAQYKLDEKSKFLWAWPTVECLTWLSTVLIEHQITSILSIGCGSGLLEWLIKQSTGVDVVGLELDNSWWKSSYSPTTFIELKFTDCHVTGALLRNCLNQSATSDEFALLFCYFNNRNAFLEYVRAYDGNVIIIAGPANGEHIVTDPNPLNPNFENDGDEWTLVGYTEMDQHINCMAVYKRETQKV